MLWFVIQIEIGKVETNQIFFIFMTLFDKFIFWKKDQFVIIGLYLYDFRDRDLMLNFNDPFFPVPTRMIEQLDRQDGPYSKDIHVQFKYLDRLINWKQDKPSFI